ncbi:MAG: ATP-binding protein [Candidatus Saliniplasma sp.]
MNLEELKRIIIDQREEIEEIMEKEKMIERENPDLTHHLEHPNILAIIGVRRCGKSIASHMILEGKKYGYLNFDDERLIDLDKDHLNSVLEAFYELDGDIEFFIFDEIQNVDRWELFVNRLRRTKKVVITGSNANLLSSELSTHLTGRYVDFHLYPFSFREYLRYEGIEIPSKEEYSTKKVSRIKRNLEDYMKKGGFPESYKFGKHYLRKIYEDIIVKDALTRYSIRNKKSFRELAKFLISNYSNEFSYSNIKSMTDINNVHTVKDYVDYLESVQIIFVLERFSYSLKKQVIAPKKAYCIDPGIVDSVAFAFSEDKGRLLENLVAIELKRRKRYWNDEWEIYYWKDGNKNEVDFIVKENEEVEHLIQVSYIVDNKKTKEREVNGLIKGSDALRCDDLTVLTWDHGETIEKEGKKIIFKPVWRWLIELDNI